MTITDKNFGKFSSNKTGSDTRTREQPMTPILTEQQILEHLKHCRDITRSFAFRIFSTFWQQWLRMVIEQAERARSNQEQSALFETRNLLRSEEHTSELQSRENLVCRLLLEKKK